jgi:hypothetical protein
MIGAGWRSMLWWCVVALLCALILAGALHGYLRPAFVIDFASQRLC